MAQNIARAAEKRKTDQKKRVDIRLLNSLVEQKKTFQVAKTLYRMSFCFLSGVVFHSLYAIQGLFMFNLMTFLGFLIAFYYALAQYENMAYTYKIQVRL